jgi:DNA-binding NarL/FixJ family response regulator
MWQQLRATLANALTRIRHHNGRLRSTDRTSILALFADPLDRAVVEELAARQAWDLYFAGDLDHSERLLRNSKPHIVLFDRDVTTEDWRPAVLSLAAACPGACIIFLSRVLDESLWSEVVANGGYEVLAKPVREEDLLRAIRLARSYLGSTGSAGNGPLARLRRL